MRQVPGWFSSCFLGVAVTLVLSQRAIGEEGVKRIDELQKLAVRDIGRYKLTVENESPVDAKLIKKPVIRFVMERCEGAFIFLWTSHQQPVAVAQIWHRRFPKRDKPLWLHQFRSLTRAPMLLKSGNRVLWQPAKNGIEWQSFRNVPAPAKSMVARRSQRKQLARKFSGVVEMDRKGVQRQYSLQLKPRELYVYQSLTEDRSIEGSIFWFARDDGNDPELLLMVEAIEANRATKWRYSVINFTTYPVDVSLDGDVVKSFASTFDATSFDDLQHVWSFDAEN